MAKCYEWVVLCGDVVMDLGEKHAPNEEQLEAYIKNVLVPKYPGATNWVLSQLFCECGSDHDVTAYYLNGKRVVKCFECRNEYFLKTRNYGTVKKGGIGL